MDGLCGNCAAMLANFNGAIDFSEPVLNIPHEPGVYAIRAIRQGTEIPHILQACIPRLGLLEETWPMIWEYLDQYTGCLELADTQHILYIGKAGGPGGANTLLKRYRQFKSGHVALAPFCTLASFGWAFRFHWKTCEGNQTMEIEDALLQNFEHLHERKPAFNRR